MIGHITKIQKIFRVRVNHIRFDFTLFDRCICVANNAIFDTERRKWNSYLPLLPPPSFFRDYFHLYGNYLGHKLLFK